jgi:tagaturonate reductase
MVSVAYLYGLRTVRESMEDAVIGKFIHDLLFEEVLPTLDFPTEYREQFARDVLDRFRNPYLKHELRAIALNSISKFKARLLPSLLEYAQRFGKSPQRITFAYAALIRFYKGEWQGEALPVNDDAALVNWFHTTWNDSDIPEIVEKVLSNQSMWEQDLTRVNGLQELLTHYLEQIEANGMQSVLDEIGK